MDEDLLNRDVWNGGYEVEAVVRVGRDRVMRKIGIVGLAVILL